MKFKDRQAAGKILAHALYARHEIKNAVVLGLPRGGVPIAFEVARACNLPLDVLVVRKLRIPCIPELPRTKRSKRSGRKVSIARRARCSALRTKLRFL
jgi:predicted phosphoribosyltransferase